MIIAIVCVFLITVVASLLARSGAARIQARRADVQREVASRRAESALEVARLAVERGRLKPGEKVDTEGLTVACAAVQGGVELTTTAEAPLPPGVTPSSLRRMLKVKWTLQGEGQNWHRDGWSVDYEVQTDRPVGTAG